MLCQEVQMKVVVVRGLERVWEPLASTMARVTSNLVSKSISERWLNSSFEVTSYVLSLSLSEAGICMIYPIHNNFFNFHSLLLTLPLSL